CMWCKRAIKGENICYKQKFYDIVTHRCVQMTPSLQFCNENCIFCWRTLKYKLQDDDFEWDSPEYIVEKSIEEHKEILQGFKGNPKVTDKKFKEAVNPKHFAVSLAGEPTLYPMLPELLKEIHKRDMTSFLVTNGINPDMLRRLLEEETPTQLYVTLAAPTKERFNNVVNPIIEDAWENLMESLSLLKEFDRTVLRLTLVKDLNMISPEKYAEIIERSKPMYVEPKGYVSVGGARKRLGIDHMPSHEDIRDFAEKISNSCSYSIKDEKEDSRVILMTK
ncbi:MAG: 4-demethylwyosine synthase TYW1, partial [Candidatus Aenigmatarchaeota archaeon]